VQHVHLPRSSVVDGTVKSKIVFKKLRAVFFHASFDEFINMALSSIYQRWPLEIIQRSVILETILAARL